MVLVLALAVPDFPLVLVLQMAYRFSSAYLSLDLLAVVVVVATGFFSGGFPPGDCLQVYW